MNRLIVLLAALFATSVHALDVKGLHIGASKSDLDATYSGSIECGTIELGMKSGEAVGDEWCRKPWSLGTYAGSKTDSYGGTAVTIRYTFHEHKLARAAIVGLSPSICTGTAKALVEKFGAPTEEAHPEFKGRGGVVVTNDILKWVDGGAILSLEKYAGSLADCYVELVDREYAKMVEENTTKARAADM